MPKRSFMRFVLSIRAMEVHLVCLTVIVVLSISLWTGDAQPDYGLGLLLTTAAYPILLVLMWWNERLDEKAAIEHIVESITAPESLRRKRRLWRRGVLCGVVAAAAWLVYSGNKGMRVDFIPAQYLGYLLFGLASAGAAGVNIWYGGPLDPRHDPPAQEH